MRRMVKGGSWALMAALVSAGLPAQSSEAETLRAAVELQAMQEALGLRSGGDPFGEKDFYLEELRGRRVLLALAPRVVDEHAQILIDRQDKLVGFFRVDPVRVVSCHREVHVDFALLLIFFHHRCGHHEND